MRMIELDKKKKTAIVVMILAMAVGGAFLIMYKDVLFTNHIVITYPNHCQEEYILHRFHTSIMSMLAITET